MADAAPTGDARLPENVDAALLSDGILLCRVGPTGKHFDLSPSGRLAVLRSALAASSPSEPSEAALEAVAQTIYEFYGKGADRWAKASDADRKYALQAATEVMAAIVASPSTAAPGDHSGPPAEEGK